VEEQLQFRRSLEAEVESLRGNTVSRQDHTRLLELHAKEAARLAVARVEAEFASKSQVGVTHMRGWKLPCAPGRHPCPLHAPAAPAQALEEGAPRALRWGTHALARRAVHWNTHTLVNSTLCIGSGTHLHAAP
jgi:hypothetical protein